MAGDNFYTWSIFDPFKLLNEKRLFYRLVCYLAMI